jgi:hypothetical protein
MGPSVRTLGVGLLSAVVIAIAVLQVFNLTTTGAQSTPPENLTGQQLIDALGLEPVEWPVTGCNQLVEVRDGVGYCIDAVLPDPSDNVQAGLLMMRLKGQVPTETDEYMLGLIEEFHVVSDLSDAESIARRDAIAAELLVYWENDGRA